MVKTAAFLLVLLVALPAAAHPRDEPQFVNRYVSFIVVADRVEAFFTLLYGPLAAVDERKTMDADGDGRISPAELDAAKKAWRARAAELVVVRVDDEPLRFEDVGVQLGSDDGVGAAAMVVEMLASRALPPGTRRLRAEPGVDPPRLGETEINVDLSPQWTLVAGGVGSTPDGADHRINFLGPRASVIEDRSVTFLLRPAAAAPGATGQRRPMLLALVAAILAATALLAYEMRRRRRATEAGTGTGS